MHTNSTKEKEWGQAALHPRSPSKPAGEPQQRSQQRHMAACPKEPEQRQPSRAKRRVEVLEQGRWERLCSRGQRHRDPFPASKRSFLPWRVSQGWGSPGKEEQGWSPRWP